MFAAYFFLLKLGTSAAFCDEAKLNKSIEPDPPRF